MSKYEFDFMITRHCNAFCPICFTDSDSSKSKYINIENIVKFIEQIQTNSADFEIHFTGGEPFCSEDFYDLLCQIDKMNVPYQIISNGTIVDLSRIMKLHNLKKMVFSIYGTVYYHDGFVGISGAFDRIKSCIFELSAKKIKIQTNIICMDANKNEVVELLHDSLFKSVDIMKFYPVVSLGRASDNEIAISDESYNEIINIVNSTAHLRLKTRYYVEETLETVCTSSKSLFINENGDIFPCLTLSSDDNCIGNICNANSDIQKILDQAALKRCSGRKLCKKNLSENK